MNLQLNRQSRTPLYLQVRNQLRGLILSHELLPGFRLPPERKLAAMLGLNRTTVANAYRELEADGLIESHVGQGTIVRQMKTLKDEEVPAQPVQPLAWRDLYSGQAERMYNPILNNMLEQVSHSEIISFAAGVPSIAPELAEQFAGISSDIFKTHEANAFEYGPTVGHLPLRQFLAAFMASRGIEVEPEKVLILSGSQQGLALIAGIFLEPGDTVIVEEPTYLGALGLFKAAGARIRPVPIDEQGIRTDILEQLLSRWHPKFIYTLPTFQNPSGVCMSPGRRSELLRLAYRYQVPVVEDDPYGELYFGDRPALPLKAMDHHNYVIYLNTFSKILFPGLRLGWCIAPLPVLEQMILAKQYSDLHSGTTAQYLVTEFCRRGLLEEHLLRVREDYRAKRDAMVSALARYGPPGLTWSIPQGGFYIWCNLPAGVKAGALLNRASGQKVAFVPGNAFYNGTGGIDKVRLCFSRYAPEMIEEGIRKFCLALSELLKTPDNSWAAEDWANSLDPLI